MSQRGKVIINRIVLGSVAFLLAAAPSLRADGFIIPTPRPGQDIPPLSVKYHRVKVEIVNQVARTSIDQVFVNHFGRDIEGTYIFPVPGMNHEQEATLWQSKGQALSQDQARALWPGIAEEFDRLGLRWRD